MNPNRTRTLLAAAGAVTLCVVGLMAFADSSSRDAAKSASLSASPALVKRGEFLVHNVVLCVDCHSPRSERGEFLLDRHLTGSVLPFGPIVPMPAWAPAAPLIAGLPAGWTEEQMVRFLKTGERPLGLPATRPPMPPYRLGQDDAEAITAYLRSLGNRAR
ncbi:MAG: hypothetical protein U1F61_02580 [Opitutaceae bacterium]